MKISYYPGCTLYTKAKNLGELAKASAELLDIEMEELENWTCCQAAFPLVTDNVMGLISPSRILINAEKKGDKLTTLCSFCYNVLKRTNDVLKNDPEKRAKICEFLEEEYNGEIEVLHFLEVLRDNVGFDTLKDTVKHNLGGLSIAPYYGCQMLRPAHVMTMDDPENPTILNDFLASLGCEVIDFPFTVECCGSFQIINQKAKDVVLGCSHNILSSAMKNGAEAVAVSCPVCYFNLDKKQSEISKRFSDFNKIPIFYFTELLGLALGVDKQLYDFEKHFIDPRALLKEKGLLSGGNIKSKEEGQ